MCVTVVILIELKSYCAITSQKYYIIWRTITIGTVLRAYNLYKFMVEGLIEVLGFIPVVLVCDPIRRKLYIHKC